MNTIKRYVKPLFSRGAKLFLAVLLVATVAPQLASINIVAADDGGYPWAAAPALDVSQYDWGYATCPANDTGCYSLPYPSSQNPTAGMADPWVYNLRNCTSYAAWKINQVFGVNNITGWGNASTWDGSDPVHHPQPYTVYAASGHTPQVGEIAQWGTEVAAGFGHVAYVYAVNGTTGSLADYNSGNPLDSNHHVQWGMFYSGDTTASNAEGKGPDHYIHIGTVTPPPTNLDFNNDGYADLAIVNTQSTGSGYTEVHPLSGASLYSTWLGHYTTIAAYLTSTQQVLAGDVNNDTHPDAVVVNTASTGSGYIEVHPLSGATNFSTWLGHYVTPASYLTSTQKLIMAH